MLSASKRLSREAFSAVFSFSRPIHGTYTTIRTAPLPHFRAGVVVSKKVAKRAVVRNRLRRRYYHILSQYTSLPLGVIVILKKEALHVSYEEAEREITHQLGALQQKR